MSVGWPAYPVNLRVEGRPCLVVGGGPVGLQKATGLLDAAAVVHVVAPEVHPDLLANPAVTVHQRPYRAGEVAGYRLVITCTGDRTVDQQVYDDGESLGVLVNSADDPERCAFTLPSRVRRGDLLVTFSTAGRSPALATWLRRRFTQEFGPEYETLLDLLATEREGWRAEGRSTEDLDWQAALDSGMLDLIRHGRIDEAKELLRRCLSSSSA